MPISNIPDEVLPFLYEEARCPEVDPTLNIKVNVNRKGTPKYRLVTIGDSLTHGFQSGAIHNTRLSYPAIVAGEMGWELYFRYPTYDGPSDVELSNNGRYGFPVNLEQLARGLEKEKKLNSVNFLNLIPALSYTRRFLDTIEEYWERGNGQSPPIIGKTREINHNLGVYGWDLRNTLSRNAKICKDVIRKNSPQNDKNLLRLVVENANELAALRVLNTARDAEYNPLTPLQAAVELGAEGTQETNEGDGIETLIIIIGGNNALGSILTFKVVWTDDDYYKDMDTNDEYTVWQPRHFRSELSEFVEEVKKIRARHVIFGTIPHVTISPLARGVETYDRKRGDSSPYFPYYTYPWILDKYFNPKKHPHLTEENARAIDCAIDQYNKAIIDVVRAARQEGRDWYVFELAGLSERLAYRRYHERPNARPSWWGKVGGEYKLPLELDELNPKPDTQFFRSDRTGRKQGGLVSLDGIHPTTVGYGITAQEVIKIMQRAGVKFYESDGVTERVGDVRIDFRRLIEEDTLIFHPPILVNDILKMIGRFDRLISFFRNLLEVNL